ncbi:MAG TPA: MerR family transcriptional regulator [Magnetospirillaceae bacterium]|jgi:DNA-binding transcriptional MerR regulator
MSEGASDGARLEAVAMRRPQKSEAAFRTISEVSEDLDVPQHVLRFWESRFQTIKPLKRGGGRRYYRPEDVLLLRRIRDLLYKDGYTIRGVQKLLREQARGAAGMGDDSDVPPPAPAAVVARPSLAPVTAPQSAPVPAPAPVAVSPAVSSTPAPERPVQPTPSLAAAPMLTPAVGITGARRMMLETLIVEIDDLCKQLADATSVSGKKPSQK